MHVIPAVDLREGKAVRLVKGRPGTETIYFENPVEAAQFWESQGAEVIHIVDLDAALGLGSNKTVIEHIISLISVEIQVGGGVRTIKYAEELIDIGVSRVVCGTSAVKDPEFVPHLVRKLGSEKLIVALDHVGGKVAVRGWAEVTELDAFQTAKDMEIRGVGQILFSSVESDGAFSGPDIESTKQMVQEINIPVLAAGGIRNAEDLKNLRDVGVYGAIVGKALYEKRIDYSKAKKEIAQ